MKMKALFIALFSMAAFQACDAQKKSATTVKAASSTSTAAGEGLFAEIQTTKGNIVLQLEFEKTPITVANFVSLAEGKNTFVTDEKLKGKPFYDGLIFHRVIKDFMIQGGDPSGNGSGGPGYKFKDEITDLKHTSGGILSMANSGPATNGSQFFITHKDTPWLDGKHTVFGHVVSGMDVVNQIEMNDVINKVIIVRKGSAAKKFDAAKVFSSYFANKAEDDKKQAAIEAEKRAQQALLDIENKKKAEGAKTAKATNLSGIKTGAVKTESGLQYKIVQKGDGKKPVAGSPIYVYYAGFLEDGTLFDSNVESVSKDHGKFDASRAAQNGYQPFPFTAGKKDGLIAGFIEALELINFGDKIVAFIPSKLGYGAQGAGGVIPPNADIIFEIEIVESMPSK